MPHIPDVLLSGIQDLTKACLTMLIFNDYCEVDFSIWHPPKKNHPINRHFFEQKLNPATQ